MTLAEELHFGRAAQRHFVVPQAFGRRIQRLEHEIGARLFDRTSRRVTLTATGERFVTGAQRVLAQVDDLALVSKEPVVDPDVLRVGVLGFGLADLWPRMRETLAVQCPSVRMTYVDLDWQSQYDAVRSGAVDVSIVHDIGPADGLTLDRMFASPRVAVVPLRSQFAAAEALSVADVEDAQWVRPVGNHPGLAEWAGPAGEYASSSASVRTPAAVPAAVAASGQLGIHGEHARRYFPHPGVRYVPLEGEAAIVSAATRTRDRRPQVLAFCRAARTAASLGV